MGLLHYNRGMAEQRDNPAPTPLRAYSEIVLVRAAKHERTLYERAAESAHRSLSAWLQERLAKPVDPRNDVEV
jgi:hypothetical protein